MHAIGQGSLSMRPSLELVKDLAAPSCLPFTSKDIGCKMTSVALAFIPTRALSPFKQYMSQNYGLLRSGALLQLDSIIFRIIRNSLIRWQSLQRSSCLSAVKLCTGCFRATEAELTSSARPLRGMPVPRCTSQAEDQVVWASIGNSWIRWVCTL